MRTFSRYALLTVGLVGCLDLDALQSGRNNSPDLSLPVVQDMTSPAPVDMTVNLVDLASPRDMGTPDLLPVFAWTAVTPAVAPMNLYGISGVGSGATASIYVVGQAATVIKSVAGAAFIAGTGPTGATADFNALWVKDAMNLWVADGAGKVYTSTDGATTALAWADKMTGASMVQRAISGRAGKDDVLVAGDDTTKGLLLNPTAGTTWSAANCAQGEKVLGVWGSPNYYVFVGDKLKASRGTNPAMGCTPMVQMGVTGAPSITAVSGTSDTDAWMVTADGQLINADLTAANDKMIRQKNLGGATFSALWVKSATDIWIVGSKIWQWDGMNIVDKTGNLPTGYTLTGVWSDGTSIWVIGNKSNVGAIFKH